MYVLILLPTQKEKNGTQWCTVNYMRSFKKIYQKLKVGLIQFPCTVDATGEYLLLVVALNRELVKRNSKYLMFDFINASNFTSSEFLHLLSFSQSLFILWSTVLINHFSLLNNIIFTTGLASVVVIVFVVWFILFIRLIFFIISQSCYPSFPFF